jgi:ribonuclease BN (tRNA processing enzyme)
MPDLELTFLGTGNAFAPGGLCWNGFLVNRTVLFEAPPQALMSLNRLGIDPNALETVVVSHHHADHYLGLPFLLLHWKYQGRRAPVRVVGPPGTEALSREMFEKVYPGVFDISYQLEWVEVEAGQWFKLNGLEAEAVEAQHDDRLGHCLGYACKYNGKLFSYTGDTAFNDGVVELARRSDVLVSECASRDGTINIHMNLVDDMPKVRSKMRDEAMLLLTHLGPDVDTGGLPNTRVARDLETYCF